MAIAIAICEDEQMAREELVGLVEKRGAGCRVDCYDSGDSLIHADKRYDVYLLDILMPGVNGLALSRLIREREERPAPLIIFITALKDQMQDAFDVQAFHYLVKPIDRDKFSAVLDKAVNECQKRTERAVLVVKSGATRFVLPFAEILFAESSNKKVIIQTKDKRIEYYGKISEFARKPEFYKCHRCYIVNLEHVVRYDANEIMLSNKQTIPLAKKKYPEFVKVFMKFLLK